MVNSVELWILTYLFLRLYLWVYLLMRLFLRLYLWVYVRIYIFSKVKYFNSNNNPIIYYALSI